MSRTSGDCIIVVLRAWTCTPINVFFFEMVDLLQARVADAKSTKEDVQPLQVSLGVKLSRGGLFFDVALRERGVTKPISGTVWDWMHVLVSNGVGNLESEKFIAALIEDGVPCKQLDEFVSQFKGVQGFSGGHLPGNFLQTRYKKRLKRLEGICA